VAFPNALALRLCLSLGSIEKQSYDRIGRFELYTLTNYHHYRLSIVMNQLIKILLLVVLGQSLAYAGSQQEAQADAWLEKNKHNHVALRQFAQNIPKGADLHSHLSGATYAEDYLRWGAELGYCINFKEQKFLLPPCTPDADVQMLSTISEKDYNALVKQMSTKDYVWGTISGHDQFFMTFDVFNAFAGNLSLLPKMLAKVINRAAEQNVINVELMITLQHRGAKQLAAQLAQTGITDFTERAKWLKQNGMDKLVQAALTDLNSIEHIYEKIQQCDSAQRAPGCSVQHHWLQQVIRGGSESEVFTQILLAFELFNADERLVGLNLVGPEDGVRALQDYRLHMEMLRYFSEIQPSVNIALHAGELTIGVVPPEHLKSHITDAVNIAGAKRIGHGVSIGYERSAASTLAIMRERGVLVEICLTSNALILGVQGNAHPLRTYLEQGIPVALATDDEGVSRIDISNEYLKAMVEHNVSYTQLKKMSRDSLTYSFLPGASIWADPSAASIVSACEADHRAEQLTSTSCKQLLANSPKANRQWLLETKFSAFEKTHLLNTP